jgi:hypothetical protein
MFVALVLAFFAACGGDSAKPANTAGTTGARDSGVTTTGGAGADASTPSASGNGSKAAGAGGSGSQGAKAGASAAADGGAGTTGAGGKSAPTDAGASDDAGTKLDASVPDASSSGSSCGRCTAYGMPKKTGSVAPAELNALSGIAVSRTQPGILFAHNDHERAVIYAIDLQGKLHARITLPNAMASDIEDIAVGPCGAQTCVFLGDIGDNAASRSEYSILRITQPMVPSEPAEMAMNAMFERFRFTYEDGSHNAESLMVGPDGSIYIVTKVAPGTGGNVAATGVSSIYKLPASIETGSIARATKVATLTVPASGDMAASAAAAHPCGQGFLVRTYNRVYEFLTPKGGSFEGAFTVMPTSVAMPDEPQSEGIDYRADGRGFITSGEGMNAPIVETDCQ